MSRKRTAPEIKTFGASKHEKNREEGIEIFSLSKISNIWRSWLPWRFIFFSEIGFSMAR